MQIKYCMVNEKLKHCWTIRLTLKSGLGDNIYSCEPPIRGVIASNCFTNYPTNGHTKRWLHYSLKLTDRNRDTGCRRKWAPDFQSCVVLCWPRYQAPRTRSLWSLIKQLKIIIYYVFSLGAQQTFPVYLRGSLTPDLCRFLVFSLIKCVFIHIFFWSTDKCIFA